jgi:hypothetical protein
MADQSSLVKGDKKSCGCLRNNREYLSGFKTCTKCGKRKTIDQFHKNSRAVGGIYSQCAECKNKKSLEWQAKHPNSSAFYYRRNPEQGRQRAQRWRENNPEKYRQSYMNSHKRERESIRGRLNNRMGAAIWRALRGNKKGASWESLVGYTVDQLRSHIEKKFTKGMSWESLMKGNIHIDHKIPKAVFNYKSPDDIDFKRCWELKNLMPMWAEDNRSKGVKLSKPFQPSFIF